jgi:hypothetical protein
MDKSTESRSSDEELEITYTSDSDEECKVLPNTVLYKQVISESERVSIANGYICRDPLNTSSYTIRWPDPTRLKIFLVRKPGDEKIAEWAKKIIGFLFVLTYRLLNSYRVHVIIEDSYCKEIKFPLKVKSLSDIDIRKINAIITIGGDGTILWASKYFKCGGIPPMIAFAMGTISYMCTFPVSEYISVLTEGLNLNRSLIQNPDYKLEVKTRIECTVSFVINLLVS